MGQELAEQESGAALEVQDGGGSAGLLAQVITASRDPQVDADKMQAMANLAMQLQDREQLQQFNRDFIAACADMPVISKAGRIEIRDKNTKEIVQSTGFAKFEDLNRVVKPILDRHNIWITFELGETEDHRPTCTPLLWHRNGYMREGKTLSAQVDSSGSKNNTQGVGSATTYLKRYTMCAALNIVTEGEDDDGNGGQTVSLPHEREQTVLTEAADAHSAGNYGAWFLKQSPKDRAFLVQSGKHAEYGGPALPPPTQVERRVKVETEPEQQPQQEEAKPREREPAKPKPKPEPEQQRAATESPAEVVGWVDRYLAKVADCRSIDAIIELQDSQQDKLTKIREGHHQQWQRISTAHSEAQERLDT